MSKRKFWLLFFVFLATILVGTKKAGAYYDPGGASGGASRQQVFEESVFSTDQFNQPSHSYSNIESIVASLNNLISGCQTDACQEKLLSDSGGAVGATTSLIAQIYASPPASSATYFADLGQRLNLTQPAYAQDSGPGFSGLRPLLTLWKNFRNVAYIFFIFIFVFVGFAMMFRLKINPQTVVTIQSAIPKAVVALILVTFSYAIAGLMIDFMYLIAGIMLAIINPQSFIDSAVNFFAGLGLMEGHENFNILTFSIYFWGKSASIIKDVGSMFSILGFLPDVIKDLVEKFPGAFMLTRNLAIELILGIILLFIFFKIFIGLIVCYVKVLLNVIVSPVRLMLGAIPGQNSFGAWLKDLTVNLLPFPVVVAMLALAGEMSSLGEKGFLEESLWVAPIIRPANVIPGLGQGTMASYVGSILAFGVLLLTARVPDIIKSMFEKKPFEYGGALGQALGAPYMTAKRGLVGVAQTAETIDKALGTEGQPGWAARAASGIKRRTSTSGKPTVTQRTPQQIAMQKRSPGRGGRGG
ncbi:MAG: hypothetical protein PHW57_03660 [Candidatus Shapirobacteria bacterium]|nr:hypothetical protein [Candidatus Shapirobacteria bacterium]